MRFFAVFGLLGSLAVGCALTATAAPAVANEALPASVARQLDGQAAEFTASAAKMRRMMIIQHNMNRQQRGYGRGGYGRGGYGRGYGYGARRGYGHGRGYGRGGGYGYRRF